MRASIGFFRRVPYLLFALTLVLSAQHVLAESTSETEQRLQRLEKTVGELNKDTRKLEVVEEDRQKAKPPASWSLKDGFMIQSPDAAYKLKIGGYTQADGRYFIRNETDSNKSQFTLRRARLDIRGSLAQYFEYRFLPDFAAGKVVLQDAYVDAKFIPEAYIRVGKFKNPIGIERLSSATALQFIERALPTQLVPNRDLGVLLQGDIARGVFSYSVGVANGVRDGGSNDTDVDLNSDKDFLGRVFTQPLLNSSVPALRGLGFGVSGTFGRQESSPTSPDLPSFKTAGQATFFSYRADGPTADQPNATPPVTAYANTASGEGAHYRFSPQGFYYYGPFSFLGEYASSSQRLKRGTPKALIREDLITNDAWQVRAGWVLTGEDVSFKGVVPSTNFDPFKGTWGAFELAGRYSVLDVDNDAFSKGYADPKKSASKATQWAVGVNWYLNPNILLAIDFDRTTFDGGEGAGDRDPENLFATRVQFAL